MTWNATLPQDRSTTANQSDLYAAAWFGLVVSDPAAWLGQCYVELQLYPDFNWSSPTTTVAGDWSGAIVGWQIDPASGNVDTCYYSQLYKHGVPSDGPFSMREGDTFSVTLRGYASDPAGENVSITDTNSTAVSTANLFNTTGNFPLNPAYPTNEFQNALLWTSGGQLPITFGFEIGREGNPGGVANSTFQGCTPGPFSPSRADPSTPCPSYDPLSWVNDTMTPWEIGTPTFFSGSQLSSPSEVDFSSTVAGGSSILSSSNETCLNRVGSSYCTYPWFGYSCTSSTFTFGATDYASESNDFGQAAEDRHYRPPIDRTAYVRAAELLDTRVRVIDLYRDARDERSGRRSHGLPVGDVSAVERSDGRDPGIGPRNPCAPPYGGRI